MAGRRVIPEVPVETFVYAVQLVVGLTARSLPLLFAGHVHKKGVMKKQVQLRINVRSMCGLDYCMQGSLRSLAPLIPVLLLPRNKRWTFEIERILNTIVCVIMLLILR